MGGWKWGLSPKKWQSHNKCIIWYFVYLYIHIDLFMYSFIYSTILHTHTHTHVCVYIYTCMCVEASAKRSFSVDSHRAPGISRRRLDMPRMSLGLVVIIHRIGWREIYWSIGWWENTSLCDGKNQWFPIKIVRAIHWISTLLAFAWLKNRRLQPMVWYGVIHFSPSNIQFFGVRIHLWSPRVSWHPISQMDATLDFFFRSLPAWWCAWWFLRSWLLQHRTSFILPGIPSGKSWGAKAPTSKVCSR